MVQLVRDLLAQTAKDTFVGRATELAALSALLTNGPRVIFLQGIAGVGKSALLGAFAEQARTQDAAVINLDCRAIEPTERGFLHELKSVLGGPITRLNQVAPRLHSLGPRVVLSFDNYEVFRLMDTWLRLVFIPLLPDNVRVLIAGRDKPNHSWLTAPGWQGLVRTITLGPLPDNEAISIWSVAPKNPTRG